MGDAGAGADSYTFSAFISYARHDRAEAVRLQRRLEQYRLDADLRVREGERLLPARPLQPIFRDEDELIPGQDLSERIRKALVASRFLIVLASPAAAKSEWVEKEILDFIALGKAQNIIVLVIDGEPNAAKYGKPGDLECLPRPFRIRFDAAHQPTSEAVEEPNWLDWRGHGKRDRINFLRLVAALLELDRFDDLLRRDVQAERRRLRFTQAVAGGMVVLFVASLLATWAAFDQRSEALIAESNFLANQAVAIGAPAGDWRQGDALRAMRIAVEGAPTVQGALLDRPRTPALETVLQAAGPHLDRLRMILAGHTNGISAATFSPDGVLIATSSFDKTIKVWSARDGKLRATLTDFVPVFWAAFSPDSKRILTIVAGSIRLWDVAQAKSIALLNRDGPTITAASFSPDGARIVTATDSTTAQIWDARDGRLIRLLEGHEGYVTAASFSADGAKIVTASRDKTARVWDANTGKVLATLSGHEADVLDAKFSPDGATIVTASVDNTSRLWNAADGGQIAALRGHQSRVITAAFSPDGAMVATASWDMTVRLWDARSGTDLAAMVGHQGFVYSVAFSKDGQSVLTASSDGTARLWDIRYGQPLAVFSGHTGPLIDASFSPD